MAWINEANWPEAWTEGPDGGPYFSPIVKSGSDFIVYAAGLGVLKIYKYNLTTQTWTYLNTTPVQLYKALAISPDGTKLAGIGINGRKLYIYSIAGNSWVSSADAPTLTGTGEVPQIWSVVWTSNDTIWCHIRDASGNQRNKCYKYVVSTDTWTQYTNFYDLGPYNNSKNMSVNSAGTALFVGGVHDDADRTKGFKYVIATDTYTQFRITLWGIGGASYNYNSDRSARLWLIDELTAYTGYYYFDCDTEDTFNIVHVFPDDQPTRNHGAQYLPTGVYKTNYIIAYHHTGSEPHDRSYWIPLPKGMAGLNPALVELLTGV